MSDRTISGIPIPQWMKSKSPSGFDPSALSPPTYDQEFIHLRYTKKEEMATQLYKGRLSEQEPKINRPHGVDDGFNGLRTGPRPRGSPDSRRRVVNRFFTLEEHRDTGSTSSLLEVVSNDPQLRAKPVTPGNETLYTSGPKPSEYREMNFWSPTSM